MEIKGKIMFHDIQNTFGNDKGQLFTLDLLLSLVPIVLVLGISANAMTGAVNQIQDYVYGYEMQHVVDDAADVLVKTTGEPQNWTANNTPSILGLAKYNSTGAGEVKTYYLDADKIIALDPVFNPSMPALLSNDTNPFSYMKLSLRGATQNSTGLLLSWNISDRSDASNIYIARRVALVKFEELIDELIEISKVDTNESCYAPGGGVPPHFMMEFNISAGELATFDYWLVAESNVTPNGAPGSSFWGVDGPPLNQIANSTDCSNYNPLNSRADDFGGIFTCTSPPLSAPGSGGDEICDSEVTRPGFVLYKLKLDSLGLLGVGTNRLLLRIPATGDDFNAYLIKTRTGYTDTQVHPEFTVWTPVYVDLEAGR